MATKVITGTCRMSYVSVFEPKTMEGSTTAKYSVSILIPKTDTKTIEAIKAAVNEAAAAGKDKLWGGKIPPVLKLPLRDGDVERPESPEYAGHFFVNASSTNKPGVVDKDLNDIIDREEFYSGVFARASVNFYPFNQSGNKGIACGLNNLQKVADGERLAGGASAKDDFGSAEAGPIPNQAVDLFG
jgi:hypothetical protein